MFVLKSWRFLKVQCRIWGQPCNFCFGRNAALPYPKHGPGEYRRPWGALVWYDAWLLLPDDSRCCRVIPRCARRWLGRTTRKSSCSRTETSRKKSWANTPPLSWQKTMAHRARASTSTMRTFAQPSALTKRPRLNVTLIYYIYQSDALFPCMYTRYSNTKYVRTATWLWRFFVCFLHWGSGIDINDADILAAFGLD